MGLFNRTPKWEHRDPNVRKKAIPKIKDMSVLENLAKNDPDIDVRRAAIERLPDNNSALMDVAKNDSDRETRGEAIKKITDETFLLDFVKNDSDDGLQAIALSKIENPAIIKEYIDDPNMKIRLMAIICYKDKGIIMDHINDENENLAIRVTLLIRTSCRAT